jgi:signal transduction histidine kinase
MQDMHDGLGSQLLTSLAMVERGALDREGMAQVLREAIDDMRLAIDTLSPGREGLVEALGNLCYRLEPRFRAAGITLIFDLKPLPERIEMQPDQALQILRVLQEALNNVLKHAKATRVDVRATMSAPPGRLDIEVCDNGRGFDASAPSGGRGLTGMRRRAERMGARFEVTSGAAGTRVALSYPLEAGA